MQRGCHRGQRIERRLDLGRDVGKRSGAVQGKQVGDPGLKFRQLGGNLRLQIVVLRRRRPVGDRRGVGERAFKFRQIVEKAGDAIEGFGNEARCLAEIEADRLENVNKVEQSKQLRQGAFRNSAGSNLLAATVALSPARPMTRDRADRRMFGLDEAAGMLGAAELDLGRSFQIKKDVARITCAAKSATEIDRRVFDGSNTY